MEKVQRLRTEIQALQEECTRMTSEVDAKAPETRLEENVSEPGWTCQTCTFHNHYLLEACETCDVPRIHLGSDSVQRRNGNSSPSSLHALRLPDFSPSSIGILPSLASPALDAALATSMPNAMCVPNMLTPSPGHEE
ncbi:hypothetical protein ONE63_008426 [Megalurothrips usitatus]|uniref:RanBP2-type domain-containing protein n=1 Tax=Megalurothrips usitatus TaxID=439358 RepID=A0AAV7XQW7_9NEOP|nr:hypothetical protein ONE63_008426 [Megalurothrips usitatus]